MDRIYKEEYLVKLKYIKVITGLTTWTKSDMVIWPSDDIGKNPVIQPSEKVIVTEIINIMKEHNLLEWEIHSYRIFYTKDVQTCVEAGKFHIGLDIYFKKNV